MKNKKLPPPVHMEWQSYSLDPHGLENERESVCPECRGAGIQPKTLSEPCEFCAGEGYLLW